MELRNLKTFQAVADHLNLTKAAEQLGYSQPAITLQIKSLEKELGHPLLSRVGKRTFLTPAGKVLKQHADKLFAVLGDLEEGLNQLHNPFGTLIVAAPEFYCTHYLSLIIKSYVGLHPQVKFQLISCNSQETMRRVGAEEADVGIIAGTCAMPGMECVIIDHEEFVLVTSTELLQKHGAAYVLAHYPFLSYQEECNLGGFIGECLAEVNYAPNSVIQCSSEETIKRAVLNQTGIAFLSTALIQQELADGRLTEIHRFSPKGETSMIFLKHRSQEPAIQTFVELVGDVWQTVREGQP